MKTKLILFALLSAAMFCSIIAQPVKGKGGRNPGFEPEKALIELKQKLDLSEQQTAEIKEILFNTEKEIIKLRENNVDARMKAMEEHKSVMEKSADEISNVLNKEQKAIFEKMKAERKELPPPPPPPGR